MSSLKNNDDLKLKLIELHKKQGWSIAAAARSLGLGVRQCQEFFCREKKWMDRWWKAFDKYGEKITYKIPHFCEDVGVEPEDVEKFYGGTLGGGMLYNRVDWNSNSGDSQILNKPNFGGSNSVNNDRILLISDMHIPYHHPDTLVFLEHLKNKYDPTRIICLGDELDKHALSFHDSDPNLPSAGDELKASLPVIQELKKLFPVMDILESNHGSLLYRKAHHHGIPKEYLKSYNEVLKVDSDWKWHYEMTIDLPNGNKCYLHHGKSANITKTSQAMSMCAVAGHYHNTFKVEYWANPLGLNWAMQCGCLIDDKSYAFNYNNVNLHRPLIGTGLIIDGLPVLEAMVLNEKGRWIGK